MRSVPVLAALATLLAAAASAQERVATSGRVLDAAGDPVGNATVTLVGDLPGFVAGSVAPDTASATTDARGRYRVALRPGFEYAAWAVGPAELHGRRPVTALHERLVPGVHGELTVLRRRLPARLRIRGAERWTHLAPLRVEVAVDLPAIATLPLPEPDADGFAPLPMLPDGRAWLLLVHDRDGALLAEHELPAQTGDVVFVLPPPRELAVRAVDAAGAPVAGARLCAWIGRGARLDVARWRELGVTDGDGRWRGIVPRAPSDRSDGDSLPTLVARDEHGAAVRFAAPAERPGEVVLTLTPRAVPRARLLDEGLPARGARLRVHGSVPLWNGPGRPAAGKAARPVAFDAATGADGELLVHPLLPLVDDVRIAVAPAARAGRPAPPWPALLQPPTAAASWRRDLARLPQLRVRALQADGTPARHTLLGVAGLAPRRSFAHGGWIGRTDVRGTAAVPVDPGPHYVFATDGRTFGAAVVDAAAPVDVVLALEPLAIMPVRLRDEARGPIGDVRFDVGQIGAPAPVAPDAPPLAVHTAHHAAEINQLLLRLATAGRDGRAELAFLAVPGARFGGRVTSDRGRCGFDLVAADQPVELVLR